MKAEVSTACRGLVLLALGCCFATGCGDATPATFPVSGQVTFPDGTTLKHGGGVVFFSTNLEKRIRVSGNFGPDGKYVLTTHEEGDGALAANYDVAVFPTVPDENMDKLSEKEFDELANQIDTKFSNPSASGLKFTVAAETSPHEFNIEVTKSKKRSRR